MARDEESKKMLIRLPMSVWRHLQDIKAELTDKEKRNLSANEVIVRIVKAAKASKI